MAILAFQKPESLIMIEGKDAYTAQFELKPLERGYGDTIGNALRRILLSSIEGYAIASIRIGGVGHEFATIPGVIEDVTNIILNLKKVRFKPTTEDATEEEVMLNVSGRECFKAGDLNEKLTHFQVVNTEEVICTLGKSASFDISLRINKGRGYVPAEENARPEDSVEVIPIDSIYTPIRKVMYRHENFRVQQRTDYEKLIIGITTDGTIDPRKAMQDAASILIDLFQLFTDNQKLEVLHAEEKGEEQDLDKEARGIRELLQTPIQDTGLSVRARNCLTQNGLTTLASLVSYDKEMLMKFRNFGKKTLEELTEFLDAVGLDFNMDISKYNL